MRPIVTLIFLFAITASAFSQGEFLHKGQSGIQFDGFYAQDKSDFSYYGGKISFSAKGVFDMQLRLTGMGSQDLDGTIGTSVYLRGVYHVIKQSDKFPFSFRAIAGYGFSEYDPDFTSEDIDLGVGISRRTYLRDNISFVPTIDLLYFMSTLSHELMDDVEISGMMVSVSFPIAFNLARNHLIHFAPFINYGLEGDTGSYGFNLGYIIPFYPKTRN